MNSKQFYKETFDAIQMSEESIRKVKNMSENNTKIRRLKTGFRAAIVAASLVAVFTIGNVGIYAATGSSLIEKVSVYINGKKADVDKITKGTDKDGNDYYKFKLGKDTDTIMITEDLPTDLEATYSAVTEAGENSFKTSLLKDDGKTYLVIGDDEKRVDITKDYKDGKATGSFKYKGKTYHYNVSGTTEKYQIDIELK